MNGFSNGSFLSGYGKANGFDVSSNDRGGQPGDSIPKGYRAGQMQQFDPRQMELYNQGIDRLGPDSYLARLASGDPSLFEDMEAPAWRQFQEAQGGLASRFSDMGMGSRGGSGFKNAANQQSIDFATQLQSKRQELMRQALQDLHSMSQDLLNQRPNQKFLIQKQHKPSGFQQFAQYVGNNAKDFASLAGAL